MRWLLASIAVLAWLLVAGPVRAADFEISASLDSNEIELGDTVIYTLQAASATKDSPSDPRLAVPQGFTLVDSGSSPSHMVSIINGRAAEKRALTAQWQLRSDRLGTFTIGPGSVAIGGGRKSATAQTVKVVAPGQGRPKPKRPGRQPFDPFSGGSFDPFKGLFPGFDEPPASRSPTEGNFDPKFALDVAPAPVAFLHATVDKTRAVVGEQVTLNVYLYEDLYSQQGRTSDVHEATAADFVKHSLLQDETRATYLGNALVSGKPWSVKLVRRNALFPIKAGKLTISPMSLTLPQARGGYRESETLTVNVAEPPAAGRPAGYQIGDTGDFSLSASVNPKTINQHDAIGVTLELRGTGNLPSALPTPELPGVEWLEPQLGGTLGPVSSDRYGGTRTFSYVVRLHKDGAIDLGEFRLPYYDPQAKTYSVARAALGIVQVAPAAGRDAGADVAEEVLPNLPKARAALEGHREARLVTERSAYWAFVFGAPFACASVIVLAGVARKTRERRANAAPSPDRVARERRAEAEAAARGADGSASVAATVRAIEAALLASTGVNVRGATGGAMLGELVDAGLEEEAAAAALAALTACEAARFAPSGVAIDDARELWRKGVQAVDRVSGSAVTRRAS